MPVLPGEIRKCSRGQARNVHEFHQNFMTQKKRNIVFVARPLNKSGQMTRYTKIV